MFESQVKNEKLKILKAQKNIDEELVKIKVCLHTLEKLMIDTSEIEKQLENVGIEFYKFKTEIFK